MCEVSNLQTPPNSKKQPHFGELLGKTAYGLRRIHFTDNLFHSVADIKKVSIFVPW